MADGVDPLRVVRLPGPYDELAPDLSEIRVLTRTAKASLAHGTLPPGRVSLAVRHRTIVEVWYILSGRAEIWRKLGGREVVVVVSAGDSLTIPLGADFQFRTLGDEPYCFLMWTMPPWPGDDEAVRVSDYWPVAGDEQQSPS